MDREQDQTKDANVYPPEAEQMRPSHASPGSLLGIPFTLPLLSALVWKPQLQDVTMDKAWLPILEVSWHVKARKELLKNFAHWEEEGSTDPRPIFIVFTAFLGLYKRRTKARHRTESFPH